MMRRFYVICLCSLFVLGACGGNKPSKSADGAGDGAAKVSIVSPKDGAEVKISKGTVKIEVSGFRLANKMGMDAEDGEGHVIYYIWNGYGEDGTTYEIPTVPGQPANSGGTGFVALASAEKENHWTSFLVPGKQKFAVQLVNNDNTPLEPAKVDQITVTVTGTRPTPEPGSGEGGGEGRVPGGGGQQSRDS